MLALNNKVKHLVGKLYYDDKFGKTKTITQKSIKRKKKHLLHSYKIKTTEPIVYIEVRRHFTFNYIDFIYKVGKERKFTNHINKATSFSSLPKKEVLIKETYPNMKHFIIVLPLNKWTTAKDKLFLLQSLYPKKYYPDLYIVH
ncbi:hypothetical protein [Streptococcus ovis]|uniref:hypothetical protein n=1 Tax=Streptococcus ovis TaxID=82806 RepID=UPI00035F1C12|nr:hypothetical protein [Streptococcus ovis]